MPCSPCLLSQSAQSGRTLRLRNQKTCASCNPITSAGRSIVSSRIEKACGGDDLPAPACTACAVETTRGRTTFGRSALRIDYWFATGNAAARTISIRQRNPRPVIGRSGKGSACSNTFALTEASFRQSLHPDEQLIRHQTLCALPAERRSIRLLEPPAPHRQAGPGHTVSRGSIQHAVLQRLSLCRGSSFHLSPAAEAGLNDLRFDFGTVKR